MLGIRKLTFCGWVAECSRIFESCCRLCSHVSRTCVKTWWIERRLPWRQHALHVGRDTWVSSRNSRSGLLLLRKAHTWHYPCVKCHCRLDGCPPGHWPLFSFTMRVIKIRAPGKTNGDYPWKSGHSFNLLGDEFVALYSRGIQFPIDAKLLRVLRHCNWWIIVETHIFTFLASQQSRHNSC